MTVPGGVWAEPLERPRVGHGQVAVKDATPDDLLWLNCHAQLAGGGVEYVRWDAPGDRSWITLTRAA